jgi:hypothetical protein
MGQKNKFVLPAKQTFYCPNYAAYTNGKSRRIAKGI